MKVEYGNGNGVGFGAADALSQSLCEKSLLCHEAYCQILHLHTLYTHHIKQSCLIYFGFISRRNPAVGMTKPHNLMPILAAGIAHRPCLRLVL